ncbi:MAG: hypothetical protein A3H35_17050 [Betaproteobacteria bacterium RIFCSPLOWO2_02_FULL_62_17]|nr:MAG: hypothetical protein A3H35_17050 [Betaproteobacteria bacterium RIFCSPLOWO2_02_FULL_62_17]
MTFNFAVPANRMRWLVCMFVMWFSTSAAPAQVDIDLWHGFTGLRSEAITRLANQFNASQSAWRVRPVYKGSNADLVGLGLAAQREKRAPHLLHLDQAGGAALAANRKAYRPVQMLLQDGAQRFRPDIYLPGALETSTDTLGRVMSLPLGAASVAFYFNREIFLNAGLNPDKPPHTWREVQEAAMKIIDAEISACGFASDRQTWVLVENVLAMSDESVTEQAGPFSHITALNFSNRLLMRHIGMLSSWAKSELFSYFGPNNEAGERFAAGECAMLASSSALYAQLLAKSPTRFGMAPMPVYEDFPPHRTLSSGSSIWVLTGKPQKEYRGVASFLTYLSSPEARAQWHQLTGDLPLTRQAYEITKKAGFYQHNPWAEVALQSARLARRMPSRLQQIPLLTRIRAILDDELEEVWAQRKTPKEALDDASERSTRMLHRK